MKTPSNSSRSFAASLAIGALGAVATLGASSAAFAGSSTPADNRGYQTCVKALDTSALTGVVFPRVYYMAHQGDSKTYYLNASAWEDGVRVVKRITCETSRSGRQVNAFSAADGRFALADDRVLEVAER